MATSVWGIYVSIVFVQAMTSWTNLTCNDSEIDNPPDPVITGWI